MTGDAPSGESPASDAGLSASQRKRLAVGDAVRLARPHPCGGFEWTVTRVGADVGLECRTCGRRVMLPRDEFNRRVRE